MRKRPPSGGREAARSQAHSARRRLAPAAFRINIPVVTPRVSGSHPFGTGAGWLFPPARLPVICVPFIAMISSDPDMIPAWTNGTMLPDAHRRSKLDYDLRMSRYYSKGKAKKRSENQISHFLLQRPMSRCVAVHGREVSYTLVKAEGGHGSRIPLSQVHRCDSSPEMNHQQNDADTNKDLARQQQPWMGSAGQHQEQAGYRGPASDRCQGITHAYIIARGVVQSPCQISAPTSCILRLGCRDLQTPPAAVP